MGRLVLPTSGSVYVDTPPVIYSADNHPVYGSVCAPLWQPTGFDVISSELTLLEILVDPLRNGNLAIAARREALWSQNHTHLMLITQSISREAAQLRADIPGLKTPDAIHAATALYHGCALFVTNDKGLQRIPNLPLVLLDDVLAAPQSPNHPTTQSPNDPAT